MSIKIFFTILLVTLLLPVSGQTANEQCLSVATDNNGSCASLKGNYSIPSEQGACGELPSNSICCCPQTKTPVPAKYIIVGSLVALFGGATVLILIFRKNELQ